MNLYFVSNNEEKYLEYSKLAREQGISVIWHRMLSEEIMTNNIEALLRQKAVRAYQEIRRPLFVEHTILKINAFHGLLSVPADYFYSSMKYEDIVEFCRLKEDFSATAECFICYCDGKRFTVKKGMEKGRITSGIPKTAEGFMWDDIFIPVAEDTDTPKQRELTGETCSRKRGCSMRRQAWEQLAAELLPVLSEDKKETEYKKKMEELADLISGGKVMLFLGAGISASVGFPSWEALIKKIAHRMNYDGELFLCHGGNMLLAEFARYGRNQEVEDLLKREFSVSNKPEMMEKLHNSFIYKALYEMDFPVIYTTNYDQLIEEYYRYRGHKISRVVHVGDLESERPGVTRIMKFHGDIEDEGSIVLAEREYYERMDFQSFMDVMLQADMLRYHVLFLGYSLSDINVKLLLYYAQKKQRESREKKKYYIFAATPNPIQHSVFARNGIEVIAGEKADKEEATEEFLGSLAGLVGRKSGAATVS